MLEQFGFEVEDIEFEHFTLDDKGQPINSTIYKCAYMKEEIIKMLQHYKNNMK